MSKIFKTTKYFSYVHSCIIFLQKCKQGADNMEKKRHLFSRFSCSWLHLYNTSMRSRVYIIISLEVEIGGVVYSSTHFPMYWCFDPQNSKTWSAVAICSH